ncbi:hypothetical protein [Deinococcus yunweiensis]|uniref:hypothetical protein n=1 Tax=Deinococcus yunweiensis TaxID=367282 RepID=UPI00398EE20E
MNKAALGVIAVSLSALLASCGSSGGNAEAQGRILDLSTEYTTSTSPTVQYAGCDRVNGATTGRANSTQVKVEFSAVGSVQSIQVSLAGTSDDKADPNFTTTIQAANLKKNAAGNYEVLFDANSATGALLPAAIIVEPVVQPVKPVTATKPVGGSFYALVKVNTTSSSFTLTSKFLRSIPVFEECTIQTAQPLSR